jgi:hypothetical protein
MEICVTVFPERVAFRLPVCKCLKQIQLGILYLLHPTIILTMLQKCLRLIL